MRDKRVIWALVVPAFILLIPWVAMRFTDEVGWDRADFAVAWVLMAGVGLAYVFVTRLTVATTYRVATALGLVAAFMLIWGNLAVGFIGSEDNPANLLYLAVLLVGGIGAGLVRLEARGMARVMTATALVQALVPVVAVMIWRPEINAGVVKVFLFNAVFVLLFAGAAWLYRCAGGGHPRSAAVPFSDAS